MLETQQNNDKSLSELINGAIQWVFNTVILILCCVIKSDFTA